MRVDKDYKETLNKFFNDYVNKEYGDELETGKAILLELQRKMGTEGKFYKRAGNGFVEVDNDVALDSKSLSTSLVETRHSLASFSNDIFNAYRTVILKRLAQKSQSQTLPRHQNRTNDSSRAQFQSQEEEVGPRVQTLARDNLSEAERVELLEYFGRKYSLAKLRFQLVVKLTMLYFFFSILSICAMFAGSIIVNFLSKSDSCEWNFRLKRGLTDQWIAVKKGIEKKDAQEDVTMMTGLRKIANWAFREGHFEAYANDEYGLNMLERKGLSAESYKIIFDEESGERSGNDAVSRRTVSPNSSPRENEDRVSTMRFQLRGEERSEYTKVYRDVVLKLTSASDGNGKQFFGLLKKCLKTKMINTQQWNAKKEILADVLKSFEVAVLQFQETQDSWFEDAIIPSIIEEAKEKLLDA